MGTRYCRSSTHCTARSNTRESQGQRTGRCLNLSSGKCRNTYWFSIYDTVFLRTCQATSCSSPSRTSRSILRITLFSCISASISTVWRGISRTTAHAFSPTITAPCIEYCRRVFSTCKSKWSSDTTLSFCKRSLQIPSRIRGSTLWFWRAYDRTDIATS